MIIELAELQTIVFEMPDIPIGSVADFLKFDENLKNDFYKVKFVRHQN
jgi:hypothetical protein